MFPPDNIEYFNLSEDANKLAHRYLSENVVGITSRPDCLHIAIATLSNADIHLSWNYKHIVNMQRTKGYIVVYY